MTRIGESAINKSVRLRDPRWEPSVPPAAGAEGEAAPAGAEEAGGEIAGSGESGEAKSAGSQATALAGIADARIPFMGSRGEPESEEEPVSTRGVITSMDPRLVEIEPLLARGDWEGLARHLGPPEKAGSLPPTLGLLYAVARREAAGENSSGDANEMAIRCMASLFGVPPESATALVLAKRLLRKNPAAWRTRSAPPTGISVLIMMIALVLGGFAGWYLRPGTFR